MLWGLSLLLCAYVANRNWHKLTNRGPMDLETARNNLRTAMKDLARTEDHLVTAFATYESAVEAEADRTKAHERSDHEQDSESRDGSSLPGVPEGQSDAAARGLPDGTSTDKARREATGPEGLVATSFLDELHPSHTWVILSEEGNRFDWACTGCPIELTTFGGPTND